MKTSKVLYSALCCLTPDKPVEPQTSEYCCYCLGLATDNKITLAKAHGYLKNFQPANRLSWWGLPNTVTQGERFMALYWSYLDALEDERITKKTVKNAS